MHAFRTDLNIVSAKIGPAMTRFPQDFLPRCSPCYPCLSLWLDGLHDLSLQELNPWFDLATGVNNKLLGILDKVFGADSGGSGIPTAWFNALFGDAFQKGKCKWVTYLWCSIREERRERRPAPQASRNFA